VLIFLKKQRKKGNKSSLFWFGLDECQVPTKVTLSLPFLSWTGEKKYDERLVGRDEDREISLTNYHHRQNKLDFGKKKFNLSPTKSE